jgi:MYXO-CTERM domain-containing protein
MRSRHWPLVVLLLWSAPAAAQDLVIDGDVPMDATDHFFVPFDVPAGTVEIEVAHDDQSDQNVLDWGLNDPDGFRGWGGGNDEPAIVGVDAASRSYLPGPIAAGQWSVVVGKVQVDELPATYHIEITFRDSASLAPQPERAPYVASPPLRSETRWYAGDFHVHSRESGDARPALDEIATFARSRGLDFVELSDHNTNSQLDFISGVQADHPELLIIPGVEWTTYDGHGNGIGAVDWVDHKIGQPGITADSAVSAYQAQGALFSINHPAFALGSLCFGCEWLHDVAPSDIDAVEIATVGWIQGGGLFSEPAIAFWDELLDRGSHAAPIGGSDDHRAGQDLGSFQSPIGDPTTMVFASELSVEGIVEGVRSGRTVVKLQGPDDPMIELTTSAMGDTTEVIAEVLGGVPSVGDPYRVRFVQNGVPAEEIEITSDPFTHRVTIAPAADGETRVRAEVVVEDRPRTITSHVWLTRGPAGSTPPASSESSGCGSCAVGQRSDDGPPDAGAWWLALALLGLVRRQW